MTRYGKTWGLRCNKGKKAAPGMGEMRIEKKETWREKNMVKIEYCHLHAGEGYNNTVLYDASGMRVRTGNVDVLLNELGDQGWEIAGCGTFEAGHNIYLMRKR